MFVAQMAAGSCCGTFGNISGLPNASLESRYKTTWLWPKWRLEAAAALLEHFRAAKRQSRKPVAAGSCCGTFGTFQGCQMAVSKAGKTTWLWPKWRLEAAAALLEHFRAAKRQSRKPAKPHGCGPNGGWKLLRHFWNISGLPNGSLESR